MGNEVLIRIDRNGTKYYADDTCQRCGGQGQRSEWYYTGLLCYECGGTGRSKQRIFKVYTPEYQAKLDARREKKNAEKRAEERERQMTAYKEAEAKLAAMETEKRKREEELAAQRAISKYIGTVGQRISVDVQYVGSPHFERRAFHSWNGQTERVYIHTFIDKNGNKIVWMTTSFVDIEDGANVKITGTIKEHSEYKGEKQTVIQRCKIAS